MRVENVVVDATSSRDVKTRFGIKQTYSFKGADGNWYSTGFKEPGFNKGDCITFEYTPDKYGNQVDMDSVTISVPPAAASTPVAKPLAFPTGGKGTFPIGPLDGQRSIVRQNALTNARELLCATIKAGTTIDIDLCVKTIIDIAKRFESYTTGDADAAEVLAEMSTKKAA